MNKTLFNIVALLFVVSICNSELTPTSFKIGQILGLTKHQAIQVLSREQPEIYQKTLKHYLESFIEQIKNDGLTHEQINKKIYEKVTSSQIWNELKSFMTRKLFDKFEMNKLSESFKEEIKQFPDNYFLTFEMYDLLED